MNRKNKVLVAMSGGVDSSVSACLLIEQGYQVTGAHLQLPVFLPPDSDNQAGDSLRAVETSLDNHIVKQRAEDVQRVCQRLNIPLIMVDCSHEFETGVIDEFCQEYLSGKTPNPCILCNQKIKFGILLQKLKEIDFDYLATGHYVSIGQDPSSKRLCLQMARDTHKNQAYFLYALSQEQLRQVIFPLSNYTKPEVRAIARDHKLSVENKPESNEICFLPEGSYTEFLKDRIKNCLMDKGPIINQQGKVLGFHRGIFSYTIGQRRGLGLYNPSPLYVLAIDPQNNTVIVGEESETFQQDLTAKRLNWMAISELNEPIQVLAQIRYRHQPQPAMVFPLMNLPDNEKRVRVQFLSPVKSITPGQSVVFYQDNRIIGGGVIE